MSRTIAVDLDKTLAEYAGWKGRHTPIGKPIPKMMDKVKKAISSGDKVVIFTARAKTLSDMAEIRGWLKENDLPSLEITNIKRPEFDEMWDDKAVEIVPNTGETARELRVETLDIKGLGV
jgi:hypothetical protein